jgi:hypothetical protein
MHFGLLALRVDTVLQSVVTPCLKLIGRGVGGGGEGIRGQLVSLSVFFSIARHCCNSGRLVMRGYLCASVLTTPPRRVWPAGTGRRSTPPWMI